MMLAHTFPKFKEYKNTINNGKIVNLFLYKGTNIISNIIVDGEELKDLYYEIKYSKKLRKPMVYNHIIQLLIYHYNLKIQQFYQLTLTFYLKVHYYYNQ